MSKLYLLCGVPGSGKSTWIQQRLEEHKTKNEDAIWCSRDLVRFSMLSVEEDYFAKEDKVFEYWIDDIQDAIYLGIENIYIDATHLSAKAREKVLESLTLLSDTEIIPVNFLLPLQLCLERNELRKGIGRTYVPRGVIRRMFIQFRPAEHGEKFTYADIINIKEEKTDV